MQGTTGGQFERLVCCVCLDEYNTTTRAPVVLPTCGHGLCVGCASKFTREGAKCPTCRAGIGGAPAAGFPRNHGLLHYLQQQEDGDRRRLEAARREPSPQHAAHQAAAGAPGGGRAREQRLLEAALRGEESSRPRLLFFGPPNDPETVQRLLPRLSDHYVVDHADSQAAGERLARSRSYVACVAKLGTKGNLGAEVVKALRQAQGGYPYVVFHSATARGSEQTMARLREQVAADGFFDHDSEDALLAAVMPAPGAAFTPPRGRPPPLPRLLLFGPPNDPEMPRRLTSLLERAYQVDHFDTTAAGAAAAAERPYAACVAKLGTKGNLGYQVVHALRRAQGPTPFIAVHSATAAKDPAIRDRWTRELRVDTFADHSSEQDLVQKLLSLSSRSS